MSDVTGFIDRPNEKNLTIWTVKMDRQLRERMKEHKNVNWYKWLYASIENACDKLDELVAQYEAEDDVDIDDDSDEDSDD